MLYKSIVFPNQSHEGGLIKHTSQLISLIVDHLDINISRSGWRSSDRWCFDLFGYHGLQINIDFLVFENTKTALGGDSCLVCAFWTKNTYRGVLDGEFLILLESFSEGMKAVRYEFL